MFLARMSEIQAAYDRGILRIKGLVCFEAVFILRGLDRDAVQADVARRLQQG
ncbi:Uncharacterised protein [Bordetella pertussis]|nr:Uncharacterised protein [Bordetella pertussis]